MATTAKGNDGKTLTRLPAATTPKVTKAVGQDGKALSRISAGGQRGGVATGADGKVLSRVGAQESVPFRFNLNKKRVTTSANEAIAQHYDMLERAESTAKTQQLSKPTRQDNLNALKASAKRGWQSFNNRTWSTIDWLIPDEAVSDLLGVENKVGDYFDTIKRMDEQQEQEYLDTLTNAGQGTQVAGMLTRGVIEAAPQAILAMLTHGASMGGQATSAGLSATATAAQAGNGVLQTGGRVIGDMLKNPSFWTSVATTVGPAYDEAKAAGATEFEANAVALLYSMGGAAIEVGGGIETLPSTTPGLLKWVRSSGEEALEEVLQGGLEHLTKKTFYDHEKEWVSLTDPDAVVSFDRAVQEAFGGFAIGGVLGGGMTGIQVAGNYLAQQKQYGELGAAYLAQTGGNMATSIRIAMQDTVPGTDAHTAAQTMLEELQEGREPSLAAFGRVLAESQSEANAAARQRYDSTLESAASTGVRAEVAEPVARVAARLGLNVKFAANEQFAVTGADGETHYAAGRYVRQSDTVLLNAAANEENLTGYLLAHELTHSVENTAEYQTLATTVQRMIGEETWQAEVAAMQESRNQLGDTMGADGAAKEVLAHWIGENLYTGGFARAVVSGKAASGGTILRVLDKVRLALGVKNSRSARNIAMLERLFMQAWESKRAGTETAPERRAEVMTTEDEGQYSIEYTNATANSAILELLERVKQGNYKDNDFVPLGIVDPASAEKIHAITGIDVTGWKVKIEARQLKHILKRHGANGAADHSMADDADIAKMAYILSSADEIVDGGTSSAYTNLVNGKDRHAKTVLYQKDIGRIYYYVVQAVPDTRRKTLFIDSAFINKSKKVGDTHPANALSPDETSYNVSAKTPTDTTVPQNGTGVNTQSMQNGGEYTLRDTADRINGLERPKPNEGYALTNGVSIDSIPNPGESVKKNSGNGQNAFLPNSLDSWTDKRYTGIKLGKAEYKRFLSEAMTWHADKVGQMIYQTLSNGYTYVYRFDENHSTTVLSKYKAKNIHKRREVVKNVRQTDAASQRGQQANWRDRNATHQSNGVLRSDGRADRPHMLSTNGGADEGSYASDGRTLSKTQSSHRTGYVEGSADADTIPTTNEINTGADKGSSSVQKGTGTGFSVGQNAFLPEGAFGSGLQEGKAKISTDTAYDGEYDEDALSAKIKQKKLSKRQQAENDEIDALIQMHDEGLIDAAELASRIKKVRDAESRAVAKDFNAGRRGTAAEKAAVKEANAATRKGVEERTAGYRAEQEAKEEHRRGQELRKEVARQEAKLTSMLNNPTKKRHIPTTMAEGVAELLGMLKEDPIGIEKDIRVLKQQLSRSNDPAEQQRLEKVLDQKQRKLHKLAESLSKIEAAYKNYGDESGHQPNIYDERFAARITALRETMGDKTIQQLDVDSLKQVAAVLNGVIRQVDNANKLHSKALREEADETGRQWIKEIVEDAKAWSFKTLQRVMQWQLTPERFFSMSSGWKKGSTGEQIGQALAEAQTRVLEIKRDWGEHFRELANHKEYEGLQKHSAKDLVDVGLADSKGRPMLMTRGMMLSLYEALCCQGNRTAILDGGLVVPDAKLYYKGDYKNAWAQGQSLLPGDISDDIHRVLHRMEQTSDTATMQELQQEYAALVAIANQNLDALQKKIEGMMTAYEHRLHEACRVWFDQKSKAYINEATDKVWGYKVARVKEYYPIHRDAGMVFTEINSLVTDTSLEGMGTLKSRVRSKAPVLLTDISQEIASSGDQVSRLAGMLPFESDFKKIYNTTNADFTDSVKKAIGRKFGMGKVTVGTTGEQYIDNLLADMAGARKAEQGPFSVLRRNSVRATMTLNLRVAASQLGALPTAAAELGWTYVAKAAKHIGPVSKEKFEIMLANSPYLYERCRGSGGLEEFAVAKEGNNLLDKGYQWIDKKTQGNLLGWCEKVDNKTAVTLWFGCEEWVKDHHSELKPGSTQFYKKVGEKLDQVIRKTQSNYTAAERSDMLREKSEAFKLVTMYKTDANQSWNILYEATARLRKYQADLDAGKNGVTEADVKESRKKLAGAYTGVLAGNIILSVVLRMAVNFLLQRTSGYRDDKGEITAASLSSAVGQEMLSNMAGIFVFGDAVYEVIAARAFGDAYYGMSDMGLETAGELLNTLATGNFSNTNTVKNLIQDLFKAFGIPVKNVWDMIDGFVYHAQDIRNGKFLSFEAGAKLTEANYYRRLYAAIQKGDAEKVNGLRGYLVASGKTDNEIRSGLRTVIKDSDKLYAREYEKAMQAVVESDWYDQLTDKEQKRVDSGIAGYLADSLLAEVTGEPMSDANEKAAKFVQKGMTADEYFLAQVVKNALFVDENGDEKVSKAEYRRVVQETEYDSIIKQLMLKLK